MSSKYHSYNLINLNMYRDQYKHDKLLRVKLRWADINPDTHHYSEERLREFIRTKMSPSLLTPPTQAQVSQARSATSISADARSANPVGNQWIDTITLELVNELGIWAIGCTNGIVYLKSRLSLPSDESNDNKKQIEDTIADMLNEWRGHINELSALFNKYSLDINNLHLETWSNFISEVISFALSKAGSDDYSGFAGWCLARSMEYAGFTNIAVIDSLPYEVLPYDRIGFDPLEITDIDSTAKEFVKRLREL